MHINWDPWLLIIFIFVLLIFLKVFSII